MLPLGISSSEQLERHEGLTFVERSGELKGVDKLRVESGGDFNTHAADKEEKVHSPQVWLLVPWHLVLLDHTRNNRVGSMA
jgi:hypothetical protein